MSHRELSSARTRCPRLPDMIGEYPLGRHTGLPLIMCDECGLQRVLELVAQTDHGNKGRVFFKCPRNMQGVPGRCGFFEWQREYLAILVQKGLIVMNLVEARIAEQEADSRATVRVQNNSMAMKLDNLVAAVKTLTFVIGAGVAVGAMYVMK